MTIDCHQHFWKYNPIQHSWIDDAMGVIRKDFLPQDLQPLLQVNNIDGCIAVQVDQTNEETIFLIKQAAANTFIKGVVGWVDLDSDTIKDKLGFLHQFSVIKGFRHILQAEDSSFMLQPNFLQGIAALKQFGFTYDILVFPNHLDAVLQLVKQNPEQQFVIDHIAKPYIKSGLIDEWKERIQAIAQHENVYCKISGLVTEADYQHWQQADFVPYLDIVVEAFGTSRIMFGSDWPVCLVAASYTEMLNISKDYFQSFSSTEQADFFGNNAKKFYKI